MFKKFLGFLLSLIGILVFLDFLKRKKSVDIFEFKEIKTEKKEIREKPIKDIDAIIRKYKKVLNSRQEGILRLYKKRTTLLPSDIYAVRPNLSTRTLRRDMDKLVNLNLVTQEGNTKNTRYLLKP
jgi:predicted HTH transcriptional regulator